jgi:alkaline phosphatase D
MQTRAARFAYVLILCLLLAWSIGQAQSGAGQPYVVLVSLDGFRFDYAVRDRARHLLAIRDTGASARSIVPSFPSLTFPNHTSIITGLYPAHHGIVANGFFDPMRQAPFETAKTAADGSWYGGTPLWVLAEQQHTPSATYFWPGSDGVIEGVRPSYWLPFDDKVPAEKRMEQVLEWLRLPAAQRPHFLTLYLSDTDHSGHDYGPDSVQTRQAVVRVDQVVGKLWEGIQALQLPVNLIVLSDHGMQNSDRVVDLRRYADFSKTRVASSGPIALIYPPDTEARERIYRSLKKKSRAFDVYRREETPPEWHYTDNPRIGDLVVVAQQPCDLVASDAKPRKGNHGYDSRRYPTMQGIFYAIGPNIRPNARVDSFENIHIYPFVAKILGLQLPENLDGSPAVLESLYRR